MNAKRIACAMLFSFVVPAYAADWQAQAWWRIANLGDIQYLGTGQTKEAALDAARMACRSSQTIDDWKYFCMNQPMRVSYSKVEDCGEHWTDWIDLGGAVGSPCPTNCRRGNETGVAGPRSLIQFNQFKHKFQCWRDINE